MEEVTRAIFSMVCGFLLIGQIGCAYAMAFRVLNAAGLVSFGLSSLLGYGLILELAWGGALYPLPAGLAGMIGFLIGHVGVSAEILLPDRPTSTGGGLRQRLYLRAPWLFREW